MISANHEVAPFLQSSVALHLEGLTLLKQEQWIPTDPVRLTYLHKQNDNNDDDDYDEAHDAISYGESITYLLLCYMLNTLSVSSLLIT